MTVEYSMFEVTSETVIMRKSDVKCDNHVQTATCSRTCVQQVTCKRLL